MKEAESPITIVITGALGSGKTTLKGLAEAEYASDPNIVCLPEGARAYFEINPPTDDKFSVNRQRAVQNFTMDIETKERKKNPKIIITDTCVIDQVVYARAFGSPDNAEVLYENIVHHIPNYNKILMMDIENVPFINDQIRTETPQQRMHIQQTFKDFYKEKNISYEMVTGTPEERLLYLKSIVNNLTDKS